MIVAFNPEKVRIVAALPRRTAHALHALLESSREMNMPVTAAEAMLYDEEAMGPRGTAMALKHAQRLGYCFVTPGGYWVPGNATYDLRYALEDRYLRETEAI